MGPFSEARQQHRQRVCERILAQPDLSDWARRYWQHTLASLAETEAEYNARVKQTYANKEKSQ